jgi:beta-glucosidase
MPDLGARASQIVSSLSRADKIALLSGRDLWHLKAIEAAAIPALMLTDGPHGLRKQGGDETGIDFSATVPATCFPPSATLASSWDPGLAEEVGRAIGKEARAEKVAVVLGPGLNLKRHPNCGRNFEYFSEDPLLSGCMAAGLVRGIQSAGVGACLKHFALNNQESNRMTVDVVVDERTEHELYLRGFEIAVAESQPWTVMCAYNRVNGEYCADSRHLLTDVLRDEWGFDGLVMSDWGATNDRVLGVHAGLDLEMPSSSGVNDGLLERALEDGSLDELTLDTAARRVVTLMLRAMPALSTDTAYDADEHHLLARRAAAEGTVLLANDGMLPLSPAGRIAIIGRFAEEPRYQGAGSSQIVPTRIDSFLEALREHATGADITYAPGYSLPGAELDEGAIAEACRVASDADVVVLFVGLPDPYESEGFDRTDMHVPEQHERLVEAVCAANPQTAVVLSNGAPVELPWADRPAALVEAYLGGQAGGSALVDVVFGERDPGGRLPETFPVCQADVLADRNFPGHPRQVQYRENLYVGYRQFATTGQEVRFPFGHGLSYADFAVEEAVLAATEVDAGEAVTVSVPLTNTASREGTTVLQAYVRQTDAPVHRPERELRGFRKVRLAPGERTTVQIELDPMAFCVWDTVSHAWRTVGGTYEVLVGLSSTDIRSTVRLEVRPETNVSAVGAPGRLIADDTEFEHLLGGPVPAVEPTRPYTRTSSVGDIGQTALGRQVQRVLRSAVLKQFGGDVEPDPSVSRMLEAVVMQMPLRSLVTMAGGRVSWKTLDGLIEALNGRWIGAIRTWAAGRGR